MTDKKGMDVRLTGDSETINKIAKALNLKVYENDYGGARLYFKATPDDDAVNAICEALRISNVLEKAEDYKEGRERSRSSKGSVPSAKKRKI